MYIFTRVAFGVCLGRQNQRIRHKDKAKAPPGVYLWDIPPVSLYLAISNHVAAAATLSLTLSAGPLGACRRIPHIQPPRPSPLSPLAPQSQSPHLRAHPPPRSSPSPAAISLPWSGSKISYKTSTGRRKWCVGGPAAGAAEGESAAGENFERFTS